MLIEGLEEYLKEQWVDVHTLLCTKQGFPSGSDSKKSTCNAGDWGSIPGLGRSPGEGNGYRLQYSCLENPMDRRPGGYSPWGGKEVAMTEQLSLSHMDFFFFFASVLHTRIWS